MSEDIKQEKTAATYDDVPNEIKDLVEFGIYTEEEALELCIKHGMV